jgi:hypothetical protein
MNSRKIAYVFFVVTQADQHWECRPSLLRAETIPLIFAVVGVASLYAAGLFWHTGIGYVQLLFSIPLLGVAALAFWQAARAWQLRQTPLSVESSGRVSYGEKEVCTSECVRTVRVMPDPGSETGGYTVRLELVDGKLVRLPGTFFGDWSNPEAARLFAREFAKALKVEVSESE